MTQSNSGTEAKNLTNPNLKLKILTLVSNRIEDIYEKHIQQMGVRASETGIKRNQMTGLENVADSSLKVSDLFDYVKRQTARAKNYREWQTAINNSSAFKQGSSQSITFGELMLFYLQGSNDANRFNLKVGLPALRDNIYTALALQGQDQEEADLLKREIHLQLCRQFVRKLVIQYEFTDRFQKDSNKGQNRNGGSR